MRILPGLILSSLLVGTAIVHLPAARADTCAAVDLCERIFDCAGISPHDPVALVNCIVPLLSGTTCVRFDVNNQIPKPTVPNLVNPNDLQHGMIRLPAYGVQFSATITPEVTFDPAVPKILGAGFLTVRVVSASTSC